MDLLGEENTQTTPTAVIGEEEEVEEVEEVIDDGFGPSGAFGAASSSTFGNSSFSMPMSGPLAEWNQKHEKELLDKEAASQQRRDRALASAKEELQRLYDERKAKIAKTQAENKKNEATFVQERDSQQSAGSSWQRVMYFVDLSSSRQQKASSEASNPNTAQSDAKQLKHPYKDTSRFRQVLAQLKHAS